MDRSASAASARQPGHEVRDASGRHGDAIRAEQVRLLYAQLPSALVGTAITGAFVVPVLWGQVPASWLLAWAAALAAVSAGRIALRRAFFRSARLPADARRWARRFLVGTFLSGSVWGMAGLFPLQPEARLEEMFVLFVLAGLAAGGMSTLSSYRGVYATFLIPAIVPYGVKLLLREGNMYLAMSGMLVVFVLLMALISARHYRSVAESLRFRFANRDLVDDLAAAHDRQQAINKELERQVHERQRMGEALQRAYDELEMKVQERTEQLAHSNESLRREKETFRITLASIGDGVITTDAWGRVSYLNTMAEHITGWQDATAHGRPLAEILHTAEEASGSSAEALVRRCLSGENMGVLVDRYLLQACDGRALHIDVSVAAIRDAADATTGVVVVFRDVTQERELTRQLAHQATHDALTGLVNRFEFERRLAMLIPTAGTHAPHALLYLDLDQFKVVNDSCGHAAGDDLLRQVAALMRTKLRACDTLARLGGDEFGVLLEHCTVNEAGRIANALRELMQGFRFAWADKSFSIGVSIGLVPITHPGDTLAGIFSAADSSCYAAKEMGRNRVHVYHAGDSVLAQRTGEMRWMPRIQRALAEDRFRLFWQPIQPVSPEASPELRGEVLVRMLDESGRLVPPGAFLPAAERYGLMLALDRWVLQHSLQALARRNGEAVTFSINISGHSLGSTEFLDFVIDQLDDAAAPAHRVCFEVTETSAVSELTHALRFIDALKGRGCRFALDDFGTGLSSFSYLKTLPVDFLKIDGAFVGGLMTSDVDKAMVEAVHHIGHMMGLKTIAEWVDRPAILPVLRRIGVDYAQGYALGHPQPLQRAA